MGASALFGLTPKSETEALAEKIAELSARLGKADDYFSHHQGLTSGDGCPAKGCALCQKDDPPHDESHKTYQAAVKLVAQIGDQLGRLTGRAHELGLYWDGQRLIPWADAFNPAAVASKQSATLFTGTQTQDLSDLE